ncbi:helicase C-terminal domain-containing protein [Kocuria rosea]|uniref:DEAD/DEAH box helicase n=1 Tax=Kocuria rosea TaxID=1275 RepID=A0A4R5YP26_KOCRO|nr:helicase C-terminal domain-containing protein [Kocuria rosea]TDL46491.1 DEAD/DEAH box helicase [Kocuria rosea]
MVLDLKRLGSGGMGHRLMPRDIFTALPNKPWPRLRLEQGEILKAWFEKRSQRDLVIKQNTGGGKTVVGLLIAQSSLNEGVGPAVYLVPDTYLVDQVVAEADSLGITVTTDAKATTFLASKAILVTTIHKLINGRTVFGLIGGHRQVTSVGTVIIDDAHACVAVVRAQYTIDIPVEHEAYTALLALFGADLKQQDAKGYADLCEGTAGKPIKVPFWAWEHQQERILETLRKHAESSSTASLYFPWPLLAPHLHLASATFTNRTLEIRTPCPAIGLIPAVAQAKRRVYLSATLADDGILVTDLNADPTSVSAPISPDRAADLGDRLILAPLMLNPGMVSDTIRELTRQLTDGDRNGDGALDSDPINAVVLVPSHQAADAWKPYANHTLTVTDMKPVIDRLVAGEHVGLVVLINKYDGVDLPGDACRLLVLDGVPMPLTPAERREAAALAGSRTYRVRTVQRIEQGIGRGIRDAEDYCAVLLMGNELAMAVIDHASQDLFSPATRAQLDLSNELADQLQGEGIDGLREALQLFLDRDDTWRLKSSDAIAGVEYDRQARISELALARREAFNRATAGDYRGAVEALRGAIIHLENAEKGWYQEELATYQHIYSPGDAQDTLRDARQLNPAALMPQAALDPKPLKGTTKQAQQCTDYLQQTYKTGAALRLGIGTVLDRITWAGDSSNEAEEGFRLLGLHLGFGSTRPDQGPGGGPDNLWALSDKHHAIIELKTEVSRADPSITKAEANQLGGSINWDIQVNKHVSQRTPILVHPQTRIQPDAALPQGTRIVTATELEVLKTDIRAFAADIADSARWRNLATVVAALQRHNLTADNIIHKHSVKPAR